MKSRLYNQSIRKLFKKGLYSSLLSPIGLFLTFLLDIALAHKLSPDAFGTFSFIFTIATLAATLITFGVPVATMKYLSEYLKAKQLSLASGIIIWSFISVCICSLIPVIVTFTIWSNYPSSRSYDFLLSSILVFPMGIWLWQRFVDLGMNRVVNSLLPRDILLHCILLGLVYLNIIKSVTYVIVSYAAILLILESFSVINIFQTFVHEQRLVVPCYKFRVWIKNSFYQMLNSISQLGLNRWDVLFVASYRSMFETGLYYAAVRLAQLVSPIPKLIITFIAPLVSASYSNKSKAELTYVINKSFILSVTLGLPVCCFTLVFAKPLLENLFGIEYIGAAYSLSILVLGQAICLLGVPYSTLLWMGKDVKKLASNTVFGSLTSLILCYFLVPNLGIQGAAVATTISLFVTTLLNIRMGIQSYKVFMAEV